MLKYILFIILVVCIALYKRCKACKYDIVLYDGVNDVPVYTYIPSNYNCSSPLFIVIHGADRNVPSYRDVFIPLAEKYNAIIAAPEFITRKYNIGGNSESTWNFKNATRLFNSILDAFDNPRFALIGHSAGAQFISRYITIETDFSEGASAIIAANAGSYAFPNSDWKWPYGYENVNPIIFTFPLTIYLGKNDTKKSKILDKSINAELEGKNRLSRGRNYYHYCVNLTRKNNWTMNWQKIEVDDIGHSANGMFNNETMYKILDQYFIIQTKE